MTRRRGRAAELRDLVFVLPDAPGPDQERGEPRLHAAERHQAGRLHHGAAEGHPGSAAINPIRYLPLGDFNSGQKNLWFSKLFSQRAGGASPAREGLARVGRYYGGKEDSINAGMPATGADDPIQYSCQQNFTIMTTDGYWNGQTESKGPGLYGGGLQLDGITAVGQQDGDPTCPLSDPYCPRPIWDGAAGSIHVVTNKTNAYTDSVCSLAGRYRIDLPDPASAHEH